MIGITWYLSRSLPTISLFVFTSYFLFECWHLGRNTGPAGDGAMILLLVLATYVVLSRLGLLVVTQRKVFRTAELIVAFVAIATLFKTTKLITNSGWQNNMAMAISADLIDDCARLVAAADGRTVEIQSREAPVSIRAIKPFHIVVHPPIVGLQLSYPDGRRCRWWLIVDPGVARGTKSSAGPWLSGQEESRGIFRYYVEPSETEEVLGMPLFVDSRGP